MKYKFRLEGLLQLRKFKEHKKKLELAQVGRAILESRQKMARAKFQIQEAYESVEMILREGGGGPILRFYPDYIRERRSKMEREEGRLRELQQNLNKETEKLSRLRGEVRVIEQLKAKQFLRFKREYQKKVQYEIEDILLANRGRK